jgi:hypothetical protein
MNKKQALALLQLIADCYGIINTPEVLPDPEMPTAQKNGAKAPERVRQADFVAE